MKRKRFRVTLIFEINDDPNFEIPDARFFKEQWEQTASAMEGDLIEIEKIEEMPDVETKKL